jgi:hypothetical protein
VNEGKKTRRELHAQMEPQQIIISAQYYNVLVFLYYKGMGGRGIND